MNLRLGRSAAVCLLALICTLLSQFSTSTTFVAVEPCSPGATCAAPVQKAGWPLPWIRTALSPAEPSDVLWAAIPADMAFYSLLIVLIGYVYRVARRQTRRPNR